MARRRRAISSAGAAIVFLITLILRLLLLYFPHFTVSPSSSSLLSLLLSLVCTHTHKKTTDHFLKRGFPHEKTGSKKSHNQIDRPRSCGPRGNHRLLRCCFRRRIIGRQERQHRNSSLASSPSFSLSALLCRRPLASALFLSWELVFPRNVFLTNPPYSLFSLLPPRTLSIYFPQSLGNCLEWL